MPPQDKPTHADVKQTLYAWRHADLDNQAEQILFLFDAARREPEPPRRGLWYALGFASSWTLRRWRR